MIGSLACWASTTMSRTGNAPGRNIGRSSSSLQRRDTQAISATLESAASGGIEFGRRIDRLQHREALLDYHLQSASPAASRAFLRFAESQLGRAGKQQATRADRPLLRLRWSRS